MVGIIVAFGIGSVFGLFIISLMRGASQADEMASKLFQEKYGEIKEEKDETDA